MTKNPDDPFDTDDDQELEYAEWNTDLGRDHTIEQVDDGQRDSLAERLDQELPDGPSRVPREGHRLTDPDEGLGPDVEPELVGEDWGAEAGDDLSAEERAIHIEKER
ncbi:DUF5709 domain-containing protein [Nonomuraea sp. NPDC050310]|uniref:DUF5709 domain-containing protein n=1 Tax=unclassified Nonomuraea TaxID=2593643 RepID=UPI003402DB5C